MFQTIIGVLATIIFAAGCSSVTPHSQLQSEAKALSNEEGAITGARFEFLAPPDGMALVTSWDIQATLRNNPQGLPEVKMTQKITKDLIELFRVDRKIAQTDDLLQRLSNQNLQKTLQNLKQQIQSEATSEVATACAWPIKVEFQQNSGKNETYIGCRNRDAWSLSVAQLSNDLMALADR